MNSEKLNELLYKIMPEKIVNKPDLFDEVLVEILSNKDEMVRALTEE